MKAALIEAFNTPLIIKDVPAPDCPKDGMIVELKACGVCRSDWHSWTGQDPDVKAPHVPGHEFAGVVIECGSNCTQFKIGDRVTAPFILSCGSCEVCKTGEPTTCDTQHVMSFSAWGAFAEYVAVPFADFNLVRLPNSIGFVEAAGMGCRVTTAFRALVDRANVQPGEWLTIHGCGGVGLSAVMIGKALNAKVLAIDVNADALAMATTLGADAVLNISAETNIANAVAALTGGGAHVSLDALGITETFHNSLKSLRKLGRHIQIGMPTGQHTNPSIPLLDLIYSRQLSVMGTRGMAANRFPELFKLIEAGKVDLSKLVTKRIALEQAGAALQAFNHYAGAGITVIDRF